VARILLNYLACTSVLVIPWDSHPHFEWPMSNSGSLNGVAADTEIARDNDTGSPVESFISLPGYIAVGTI